jgi:LysR family nitrogen assimilation transcriptional regulator
MDSRLLEYFLRVSELGSINKSAVDLRLSQPALSRHIAALEHEMGTQLFARTQQGVTLTDEGKLLADRARPLLRQFAILKEQVGDLAAGQVAIGIPPSWQQVVTAPLVDRMSTESPGVKLRVHEGVSHILRDTMFAGLLDLTIMPFATIPAAGHHQTALVREPLVLVGDGSAGLSSESAVPVSRLDGAKLVLPGRPNIIRALVENTLVRKGMTFKAVVETDTLSLCMDLARRGIGLTVVPACSLAARDVDESLSWAPVRGLYVTWALFENQARSHSPAVRECRRMLIDTVVQALQGEAWFGAEASNPTIVKAVGPHRGKRSRGAQS